jgi:hypothetical protein
VGASSHLLSIGAMAEEKQQQVVRSTTSFAYRQSYL